MKSIWVIFLACLVNTDAFGQANDALRPRKYEKVTWQLNVVSAESVRGAILERKESWFSNGSDLGIRQENESPGGLHFHFDQTFQGIPIFNAGLSATLNKQGRFLSLINNLVEFHTAEAVPSLDSARLKTWVDQHLLTGQLDQWQDSRAVWFNQDGDLMPAYHIRHSFDNTVHELVLADGSMDTLHFRNLEVFHHRMGTDTTGTALVFNPDPLTTAGRTYGGTCVDNYDADHADLNAQRQSVSLKDIFWNGSQFILSGPYVSIGDFESPWVAVATSADGNFSFTRSQSGFEDVMVYYHLDSFQRYIQGLGFLNLANGPISADPHGLYGQDNSHFVPNGAMGKLGFGEGGVDDAEDADVILHEYGHALSYSAIPNGNTGTERQGLDEGIGDYLAASYSRSQRYNLWKNTYTWDGHNEFWDGRSASSPTPYPPTSPNIYIYGEIWASVLMEVYQEIGRTACDRILLQSLYSNAANIGLNDAAHIIMDADTLLYGGANALHYQAAFCRRGIFDGSMVGEECYVAVDELLLPKIEWQSFPNPTSEHCTIRISHPISAAQITLFDLTGRQLQVHEIRGNEILLDLRHLPAGTYLARLTAKGWAPSTQKIHVAR